MCEDITDNMTVNSSNNGNAYVNKMINKDCCSACGSGAESETNNVKWPNQHLGPRYNNYGKSDTKFRQLDLRTLVAGELNICCGRDVSESERSARLKMLGDIVFNSAYYQWPAILKLHAAVLAEIESGNMRWGDDYSKLEQQMIMPFPVNRNKRNGNGDKGGLSSVTSSSGSNGNGNRRAQREETSHNEERVVYCGDYQHRNCNNTGNHSGQFYGQNAQLQHICAVCWKRDRVKAVHPAVSTDCPHNEAWLGIDRAEHNISRERSLPYSQTHERLQLHEKIKQSGRPNAFGCKIPLETKLNVPFLETSLNNYHDWEIVQFCKYRWPIGVENEEFRDRRTPKNHRSALDFPVEMTSYIHEEVKQGTLLGPFDGNPFSSQAIVSPLSTREKRDSTDRRVIMDLSFPPGQSVNEKIQKGTYLGKECELTYPSVDALVELVKKNGEGCLMMKRDLKRAYKQIQTDPADWNLLGLIWNKQWYFDITMPMGLRSSAMCCQRITNAIRHLYQKRGYDLVAYLDDLASAEVPSQADQAYSEMGKVLEEAGLQEQKQKSVPPSTNIVFLGVMFDSVSLTLSVPQDRVQETIAALDEWLLSESVSRKEVQHIVGKLQFLANCVRPGRLFITRILEFMRGLPDTGRHPMTNGFRADLRWWRLFLPQYNGISMMAVNQWSSPDKIFASDACLQGCGAWNNENRQFFHKTFPEKILRQKLSINALELLTIVVAAKVWGKGWKRKRIVVQCDNEVSVMVLNTGRCRNPILANCLRELELLAARHKFEIRAHHISGVENRIPDALSRWDIDPMQRERFWRYTEGASAREIFVYDGLFDCVCDW